MASIRSKIKDRLEKFIELDVNGLRSYVLSLFLNLKKSTAVASMVGYIHSKLGILRSHKESYKTPTVYSLKEEYADLLQSELSSKGIAAS